jgi:hypothetical protein
MTVPVPPPPGRHPVHPLATAGVILSCAGFAIPVVSGLVGALLGALSLQAIAREPDRWDGKHRAQIALGLGLVTGAVPLAVVLLVNRDDWGAAPIVALLAYAALVAAIGMSASRGGGKVSAGALVGGAAMGAGGVVLIGLVSIGLVLAIVFLFQTMISEIASAIGDAACGGS